MIDARHSGYESGVFVDEIHMDIEGAQILSTDLSRLINARLSPTSSNVPHWVSAPRYSGPPLKLILRDLNSTRVVAKEPRGKRS
jgi:hypothetical protein